MDTRFVVLALLGASAYGQSGAFAPTGKMVTPRMFHNATLLPNGKVLITGGLTGCGGITGQCTGTNSAELYDPASGAFTAAGSMDTMHPTGGIVLSDGRVLFGESLSTGSSAALEIYDPSTGEFTVATHSATLTGVVQASRLNDGRILLIGSAGSLAQLAFSSEIYDPVSGAFSSIGTGPMRDDWWLPVALAGGRVLFVPDESVSNSEIYDPATGRFSMTGSLGYFDTLPVPTLLPNGRVLFTGGAPTSDSRSALYDSAAGTFAPLWGMSMPRIYHSATLLPDGTVLIAGGAGQPLGGQPPFATAEIFEPATSGFARTGSLTSGRYAHTATLLNTGQVLIAGGTAQVPLPPSLTITGLGTAGLYSPAKLVPAPALFSASDDGKQQGAIWRAQTGQIVSADNPAVAGEALSMYTTSLIEGSVIRPQVAVGGRLAEVTYFGAAPGYPGYYQVNFIVPDGIPSGPAVSVRLTYLGRWSNAVNVAVQ